MSFSTRAASINFASDRASPAESLDTSTRNSVGLKRAIIFCNCARSGIAAVAASMGIRTRSFLTLRMLALNRQHIQRGFELAPGVLIAGARGHFDPFLIKLARLVHISQFLERLPAVKICCGITRIVLQQSAKLRDCALDVTAINQFHRQSIAGESIRRILGHHRFESFDSIHCPYVLLYRAMACPYFYPVARFENNPWSVPPRLPLGDAFAGICRAPGNSTQPDEGRMREVCNLGLGRHACEQFPPGSAADAIRFHVAQDAGELINIQYVFE